jgi:hypothetical protein
MVMRSAAVADLEAALGWMVDFTPDPDDRTWWRGVHGDTVLYLRMGSFPDEPLYSLYLGHGRWMDFTTLPHAWTVESSQGWPDTARPRLPKGQFHT